MDADARGGSGEAMAVADQHALSAADVGDRGREEGEWEGKLTQVHLRPKESSKVSRPQVTRDRGPAKRVWKWSHDDVTPTTAGHMAHAV